MGPDGQFVLLSIQWESKRGRHQGFKSLVHMFSSLSDAPPPIREFAWLTLLLTLEAWKASSCLPDCLTVMVSLVP